MSRVGKYPIEIPSGVTVAISNGIISVESSGKKLQYEIPGLISVIQEENMIVVTRNDESKEARSLHGLVRTLINNMVTGVSKGFVKSLEIVGRGKRAKVQGKIIKLDLGYSHSIDFDIPEGIEINVEKNVIEVKGIDKQLVGQVAANLRDLQPPEPYKGAGIRYLGEVIRKKAGKSAVGGGFTGAGK